MDNIIEEIKKLLGDDFVAIEIGTWTETTHYIHILARYCSLYQVMEITRITGDPNPLMTSGFDDNMKVITDVKITI